MITRQRAGRVNELLAAESEIGSSFLGPRVGARSSPWQWLGTAAPSRSRHKLGPYVVQSLIGAGGMGSIARDTQPARVRPSIYSASLRRWGPPPTLNVSARVSTHTPTSARATHRSAGLNASAHGARRKNVVA